MNLDNPSTLIAICAELLKRKLGEKTRIETIKARAEQGRILHQLDKKYIEKMAVYIKYEEPIEETPPPPQATPPPSPRQGRDSFCVNCGTKILFSNNFCTNCGTKKITVEQKVPPQPPNYSRKSKKQSLEEYEKEYIARVDAPHESSSNEQPKATPPPPPPPPQATPPPPIHQRPPQWKSEGITIILTAVLGLCGLGGIGHMYIGRIGRGIVILVIGLVLIAVTFASMGLGLIGLIPFAIWVVYDAYKLCKSYNTHLEQHGKAPW